MSLDSIVSTHIIIYLGMPICCAGIIGEILNMTVFLSLQTFRQNSCAFYLTVMSFVNTGELLFGFLPRIMISGFGVDWTITSLLFCKFRWFYVQLCLLTTFTCLCLAIIDQYCATCPYPHWKQYCNIKLARRLCTIFIFIWLLHGIPFVIYYGHITVLSTNTITCTITNTIFQRYFIYCYTLVLSGFLSVAITAIFGLLAYRNIQQLAFQEIPIVQQQLEKQLTTMIFIQIIFNLFAITPYMITVILSITPNIFQRPLAASQLSLPMSIVICVYYLYFSSPFYIYICASERFRRQVRYVIFDIHWTRWRRHFTAVNEVAPRP